MVNFHKIRFWQLMVGTGFALLVIGLVMIFLPPGVGDSDPYLIEFFEARIEGTELGLALIVLGLSCFLIGRKDLADLREVQSMRGDLQKTSTLAAKMVAGNLERTLSGMPARPNRLRSLPDLDIGQTSWDLQRIHNGDGGDKQVSQIIEMAESGLALLEALERDGYSI